MIYALMQNLAFILPIFVTLIFTAQLSEHLLSTLCKQFGRKIYGMSAKFNLSSYHKWLPLHRLSRGP